MTSTKTALFIHHSVGRQVLRDGHLRQLLGPSWNLWDHDYNRIGLSNPSGARTGRSFPIPDDDTDPEGLIKLIQALGRDLRNAVQGVDVLILKSCFPNSNILSDSALEERKQVYVHLRHLVDDLSLPKTVLLTSPPLARMRTSASLAARVLVLNEWLRSDWNTSRQKLVDLHDMLAGPEGWLRKEYSRPNPFDSHPNASGAKHAAEGIAAALHDV